MVKIREGEWNSIKNSINLRNYRVNLADDKPEDLFVLKVDEEKSDY